MAKASLFRNMLNKIAEAYGNSPGKMLIHTGVIGWVLSSLAQVCAIVINDKIPKEQKMFLIPQEISDAGINIISFYLITQGFTSVASKLVTSGKLLPKAVRDFLVHKGVGDKLGKAGYDIYKSKLLTPSGVKRLDSFRNGVEVVGTTLGSIISCNLVTPVARNEIAAYRQKKALESMNKPYDVPSNVKQPIDTHNYFKRPTMVAFQSGVYSKHSMSV